MLEVLEMVRFRTRDTVNEAAFLKAAEDVTGWLRRQEGFQYRSLCRAAPGEWVDLVWWDNAATARAAGAAFMAASETQAMLSMIDDSTADMQHLDHMHAAAPMLEAA